MAHSAQQDQGRADQRRALLHHLVLQPNEHRVRIRLCLCLRRKHTGGLSPTGKLQRQDFPAKTCGQIWRHDHRPFLRHQLRPGRLQGRVLRDVVSEQLLPPRRLRGSRLRLRPELGRK